MLMEVLIATACLQDSGIPCQNAGQAYIKHYKLDDQTQQMGDRLKKLYPALYYTGFVGVSMVNKKYSTVLYNNIAGNIDYTNPIDIRYGLTYKFSY